MPDSDGLTDPKTAAKAWARLAKEKDLLDALARANAAVPALGRSLAKAPPAKVAEVAGAIDPSFSQWEAPKALRKELVAAATALADRALRKKESALRALEKILPVLLRLGPEAVKALDWDGERVALIARARRAGGAMLPSATPPPLSAPSTARAPRRVASACGRSSPLDEGGVRAFAELLDLDVDPRGPEESGPVPLGWGVTDPEVTLREHEEEVGKKRRAAKGKRLDVRTFQPFKALDILGADSTGDLIVVDERKRTKAGTPPVVRFFHDQAVTAELEAK